MVCLPAEKRFCEICRVGVVGETVDIDAKRGYVLTLSTREQHIRREKATSNICSNQGICAMTAAAYMASIGGTGLKQTAKINYDKAEYLKNRLLKAGGKLLFSGPTFNEFAMIFPNDFGSVRGKLIDRGIVAGLDVGTYYPEYENPYLFCVTETASKEILDELISEVQS